MSVKVNRSLALPTSEYYAEPQVKSGIALHHTVSDNAHSAVSRWHADMTATGKPRHVATGYDAAYASHQDLTRRYIAELNKPRIRLPSIVGFVAAAGVGFVVGRVVP